MNPQEKSLIDGVFDRLARGSAAAPRDAEAMTHIQERLAVQPDAVYGLVQAVIMQEMALGQTGARIAELEKQLAQAQSGAGPAQSSFLGGTAGPWGRAPQPAPQPQPQYSQPQPQYAQPLQPQPLPQYVAAPQYAGGPWGAASGGGGFLGNVATMAAGVAAGSLLADGLASLFGGHHYYGGYGVGGFGGYGAYDGFGGGFGAPPVQETIENVTVNNYNESPDAGLRDDRGYRDNAGYQDQSGQDPSYQDASFDPNAGGLPDDGTSFDDTNFDDGNGFDDGGGFDSSDV